MDNASIHHTSDNINLILSTGVFLPPYSPDLNPLEQVFSEVKAILKENNNILQCFCSTRSLLAMSFSMITINDCFNFIKYCGYI